jgi:hypothetical protein
VPCYTGVKFVWTENDLHYSAPPFEHPGHDYFKGCSGAPILSESGELVALVIGGDDVASASSRERAVTCFF